MLTWSIYRLSETASSREWWCCELNIFQSSSARFCLQERPTEELSQDIQYCSPWLRMKSSIQFNQYCDVDNEMSGFPADLFIYMVYVPAAVKLQQVILPLFCHYMLVQNTWIMNHRSLLPVWQIPAHGHFWALFAHITELYMIPLYFTRYKWQIKIDLQKNMYCTPVTVH